MAVTQPTLSCRPLVAFGVLDYHSGNITSSWVQLDIRAKPKQNKNRKVDLSSYVGQTLMGTTTNILGK